MGALCHQPFGLGRQPSGCCVRLLDLGTAKASVAFLLGIAFGDTRDKQISASLGWRPSAAPTQYLDRLLGPSTSEVMPEDSLTERGCSQLPGAP